MSHEGVSGRFPPFLPIKNYNMAREGVTSHKKNHRISVTKGPTQDSQTSKKRANRGFKGVESTKMHKRAYRRLAEHCTFLGKLLKPGEKTGPTNTPDQFKAGGALKYH